MASQSLKMSQPIATVLEVIAAISALSSLAGGGSALIVDFFRRRVRAKAADYAAQNDFKRLGNAVELLQSTLEKHSAKSAINHSEISQRVARLEGQYDTKYPS